MKAKSGQIAVALNRLDASLAGAKAARLEVWFFVGPLFVFFTWIAFRESLPISREHLLAVDLLGQLVTFATYRFTRGFVTKRAGQSSVAKLLIWYLVVSLPSELMKDYLLGIPTDWHPDRPVLWLVVPLSCMIAGIWLLFANLAVNWFSAARDSLGQLKAAEKKLKETRSQLREQLNLELEKLRTQVESTLVPEIERLRQKLRNGNHLEDSVLLTRAAEIRSFCDHEVRALGREITERREQALQGAASKRLGFLPALLIIVRNGDISLNKLFIVMLTLAIPYATNSAGYQAVLVTAIGLSAGYVILRLVDPLRRKLFGNTGVASFGSGLVMYLSISWMGVWILNLGLPLYASLWDYIDTLWWLLPVILVFVWLVLGFVFGANDVLKASIEEIAETNLKLVADNQKMQSMAVLARKRVYKLLHGSVQGRLAAVSLALTAMVDEQNNGTRQRLLHQALEQMLLAEVDLKNAFGDTQDTVSVQARIEAIVAAWRNLLRIDVHGVDQISGVLEAKSPLTDEVVNAFQEGITNAHRHSRASSLNVAFEVSAEGLLTMRLVNDVNVSVALDKQSPGTGLEHIASGAYDLAFRSLANQAELFASWQLASR